MKPIKFRDLERKLKTLGFVRISQKGSHIKFARLTTRGHAHTVTVPNHSEVAAGTLKAILTQIDITEEAWEKL